MGLKLCYVDDCFLYFTSRNLEEVWGDDWDDAPYQCNAGPPYDYELKVGYEGPFFQPCNRSNAYSVQVINNRAVPWLESGDGEVQIWAGDPLKKVLSSIQKAGGAIYYPLSEL